MDKLDDGYDKDLFKDVNAILEPLLTKVVTEAINKEIYKRHIPHHEAAKHNIIEFRLILEKYHNIVKPLTFEEQTRLALPYYLMLVESLFTADITLLIYLLINNKVKYYRTKSNGEKVDAKITNLKEINEETLFNKLIFLKENGFSLISDSCDRDLRNSIAHMDFIVFENGSLTYEKMRKVTTITKDDLEAKIGRLLNVSHCISESIRKFYEFKYGSSQK